MGLLDILTARRRQPAKRKGIGWVGSLGSIGLGSSENAAILGSDPTFNDALGAYRANATVRACVDTIADAAASVPFVAYTGEGTRKAAELLHMKAGGPRAAMDCIKEQIDYGNVRELDGSYPVIGSLLQPNPEQSRSEWVAAYVGYQLLAGNAYLYSTMPVRKGDRPRKAELYFLNPDYVLVKGDGSIGGERRYVYRPAGGGEREFGSEQVLHIKSTAWNSEGVSALSSCSDAVNQNTLGRRWNSTLLANNGKPAAHANYDGEDGLDEEGYENLLESLNRFFSPQNNGKVILTTNTTLKEWGLTPNDMSWLSGIQDSSREICRAFRIAPQILGDMSTQTYANYKEARQSLYMETVIPIVERLTAALTRWYRAYDETFLLIPNVDEIEALAENINDRFTRANAAQFLSVDERRMIVGYEPIGGEQGKSILVQGAMAPLDMVVMGAQWIEDDMQVPGTENVADRSDEEPDEEPEPEATDAAEQQ